MPAQSAPAPPNWQKCALRLAAMGIGSAAAGPLGAVVGAWLGGAISDQASKALETWTQSSGGTLASIGANFCTDQLKRIPEAPPLEAVVKQALDTALHDILENGHSEVSQYADWFDNWSARLRDPLPSGPALLEEVRDQLSPGALKAADPAAQERRLDLVFKRTLERLDGEAAARKKGSLSLAPVFRSIPEDLFQTILELLPQRLEARFEALIILPEHERAWKQAELHFQKRVTSQMGRVEVKEDRILEILEHQLARTEERARESEQEVRALRAELKEQGGRDNTVWEFLKDQLLRAEEEARVAKQNLEAALADRERYAEEYRKLLEQVTSRSAEPDPEPGEAEFGELLDAGDLDGAIRVKNEQVERRRGKVEKLARDLFELGTVHELRFDFPKALEAYREAWDLKKDPKYGFKYAYCAQKQNRFREAVQAYETVLTLCTDPTRIATTLNNLGLLYSATQRMKESEAAYREALSTYRTLAQANADAYLPYVAATLNNLGLLYGATQRMQEAEAAYREALSTYRRLAQANPHGYLRDVAGTLNNLANLYSETQRMQEAEAAYREALSTYRTLAQANPDAYLPYVAATLNNLALLYRDKQRMKEAEAAHREALSIRRTLVQANPDSYLPDVATTLNNLANLYRATQRMQEAEAAYREALSTYRTLAQANPDAYLPDIATSLNNLANLYRATQRMQEAEAANREAVSTYRTLAQANPEAYLPYVAATLNNLAILYRVTQRMEEAQVAYQEALSIYRTLAQANSDAYLPDVAMALNNLAILHRATQRMQEAEACGREAQEILEPLWKKQPELHGDQMARILLLRSWLIAGAGGSVPEACELARRALEAAFDPSVKSAAQAVLDGLRC